MYDIIISNGVIIDGSGKKSFPSAIAVLNGIICQIEKNIGFKISPGFHEHE